MLKHIEYIIPILIGLRSIYFGLFTNKNAWMSLNFVDGPSIERIKFTNIILGLLLFALGIGIFLKA